MSAERGSMLGAGVRPAPSGAGVGSAATGVQEKKTTAQSAHARALGGVAKPVAKPVLAPDLRAAFDAVQIRFDAVACRDLTRASKKEWLLTNGLGGYSMSTISGLNTRRHHGLLVAAMRPPVGRVVVLSKMDETLDLPAGPLALDTNFYPGVVHPRGFERLESFTLYPLPTTVFAGPGWRLEKTIHLVHGENTVVVTYKMLSANRSRRGGRRGRAFDASDGAGAPDLPAGDSPSVAKAAKTAGGGPAAAAGPGASSPADGWTTMGGAVAKAAPGSAGAAVAFGAQNAPPAPTELSVSSSGTRADAPGGAGSGDETGFVEPLACLRLRVRPLFAFRAADELATESERLERTFGVRNFDAHGSIMRCTPYPEWEPVYLVSREARFVDSGDWYKNVEYPQERYCGREFREDLWSYGYYEVELHPGETFSVACTLHPPEARTPSWPVEREIERRTQAMARGVDDEPFSRRLALAAEQFLVRRGRDVAGIVAGYPWLADRARDTMIALPGLTLVTGRFREAKAMLRAYARALDRGMLPNRFPDGSDRAEYGTVDSTLWFVIAIFKYLQYTGDFDFVKTELRIPLLEMVRYYGEGTRYGIRVDSDGLLRCGEPGMALTWMDARVGDQAVTPRVGKPVEINALWYNALKIMERLAERFSIPSDMARFAAMAERVEENFVGTFWNDTTGCLNDLVEYDRFDAAIRPNQILAVSLPFPLLDSESAQSVVHVVGEKLLVSMGLRTLDPQHCDFKGIYDGDAKQRHAAYHQGTAWSWLMGPYVSALVKANGATGRVEAAKLLKPFEQHLFEDGLGQISEIFWGQAPHWPRGCPASACAVAEILRAYHEDVLDRNPGRQQGVQEPSLRSR